MSVTSLLWNGRMLVGAFVLLSLSIVFPPPAGAQEDPAAPAPAETVREGIWVDFFFGTGVDPATRAILGEAASFPAGDGRIYCLTRVHGMSPPTTVTHAWYHEGKTRARVDLNIGSENWRTWSYKTMLPAWTGYWEVKVLDEDGMVLGSAGFEVE
jgi:hypothetical protein